MKILISVFTYPPDHNGVARAAFSQAEGLSKLGYNISVCTSFNSNRNMFYGKNNKIKIFEFNINGGPNKGYFGESDKYKNFLLSNNFDIIFFHCWQTWNTDIALKINSKISGKKILISHGVSANLFLPVRSIKSWLSYRPYIFKMRYNILLFDHIVFLCDKVDKNRFYDVYLAKKHHLKNFSIIPNGIEIKINNYEDIPFKKEFKILTKYLILNISNFDNLKNQKMAIAAFIRSKLQDTSFILIGGNKNSYFYKLKKIIKKNNYEDKIFLLNNVSQLFIKKAYQEATIFLFTSRSEVQPFVLLDAMAAGLPFISTNVSCLSNCEGGIEVKKIDEICNKMKFLLDNDNIRNELGERGKKLISEHYNLDLTISLYDRLIQSIIKK